MKGQHTNDMERYAKGQTTNRDLKFGRFDVLSVLGKWAVRVRMHARMHTRKHTHTHTHTHTQRGQSNESGWGSSRLRYVGVLTGCEVVTTGHVV